MLENAEENVLVVTCCVQVWLLDPPPPPPPPEAMIVAVAVEGAEAEPAELAAVTTERTVSPTSLAWSV